MPLNLLDGQIQLNYRILQHTPMELWKKWNTENSPIQLKICYWIAKMVHKHIVFLNSILTWKSNLREILCCVWPQDYMQILCTQIRLWWSLTLVTSGLCFCKVLHLGVKRSPARYWTQQPAVSKAEIIRNMKPPLHFSASSVTILRPVYYFLGFMHERGP